MLVLAALNHPADPRPDDHSCTIDGELAIPSVFEFADDSIWWRRAWIGLESNGATSAVEVVERSTMTEAMLRLEVRRWLDRAGWSELMRTEIQRGEYLVDGVVPTSVGEAIDDVVEEQVRTVLRMARFYGQGAVLSRFDDLVSVRHARGRRAS